MGIYIGKPTEVRLESCPIRLSFAVLQSDTFSGWQNNIRFSCRNIGSERVETTVAIGFRSIDGVKGKETILEFLG